MADTVPIITNGAAAVRPPLEDLFPSRQGATGGVPAAAPPAAAAPAAQPPPTGFREFADIGALRDSIFKGVETAVNEKYPISNQRYTLRTADVGYRAPKSYSLKDQKRAIMRGQTLGWGLAGRWELVDNESGKVVDKTSRRMITQVPYLTDRGTFIYNGSEYTVASQMRLRPGVYTRVKDNGIIEAHFNVRGGSGPSFRVFMEPESGVFRINVGQANLKLYPILKSMGFSDRDLQKSWGRDLLHANVSADDPRAVPRAYQKLLGRRGQTEELAKQTQESRTKQADYVDGFSKMEVNYSEYGSLQSCSHCKYFQNPNACGQVQGFVAPHGWCVLWDAAYNKRAEAEDSERVRVKFTGTIRCDDSKPTKPWAYVEVHPGLASAAFDALKEQEFDGQAHFKNPHITLIKTDETKALIAKYGVRKWKSVCGNGKRVLFNLSNVMVGLDPEGWKTMKRVWFLEVQSPQLRAHRKSLDLPELPHGEDGEQQFHITVAVQPYSKEDKKRSALDSQFADGDNSAEQAKAANELMQECFVKEARRRKRKRKYREPAKPVAIKKKFEEEEKPMAILPVEADLPDWLQPPDDDDVVVDPATMGTLKMLSKLSGFDPDVNIEPEELAEAQAAAEAVVVDNPAAIRQRAQFDAVVTQDEQDDVNLIEAMPEDADVKIAFLALTTEQRRSPDAFFEKRAEEADYGARMREVFEKMELDDGVTNSTLGQRAGNVSPQLIVDATQKLVQISNKEAETDDRDALAYQQLYGPEDLFAERITRDAGQLGRKLLWRATLRSSVQGIPAGALSPQMRSVLLKSGLGSPLEEVNPLEIFDQQVRVTRMGEGGMPSDDSVPDEARSVQPSHFGVIDPVRAPEGTKIGVDSRVSHRTYKGSDGDIYTELTNARTGKKGLVGAPEMATSVVAFPGELSKKGKKVRAMVHGKRVAFIDRKKVDYELPDFSHMFTATSNMVPMISAIKGGRLLMGAKMATQALPLQDAEAPLVQNQYDSGDNLSFESVYGDRMGAVRAKDRGVVQEITRDHIKMKYADGSTEKHPMYHNFPFNRKTYIHNTPSVKVGDTVTPKQLIAKSNFTDGEGVVALGKNLRVGYMAYRGYNADDAIVISDSTAKKLSSEHMYTTKYKKADNQETGKRGFMSIYPGTFDKRQLGTVDDNGVVKIGTSVQMGDPLVLAISKRKPQGRGVIAGRKTLFSDAAETWEHHEPGVVTDVDKTKDGWKVFVKAYSPMNIGDKLSNRYGGKGVVSRILPDDQMPHDAEGTPLEIMLNPEGIVSRVNPAQLHEALLGKVAKKTGVPYRIPGSTDESYVDFVKRELQRNGLTDTEDLVDPTSGRKVPKVYTGQAFMMKLHHMAEPKSSGRDVGAYTSEGQPTGSGQEGSKRLGIGEMTALVSHGASELIRDAKVVRGQRNDDYWRALRLGYTPPSPKVPQVYEKFLSFLKGAGINLNKRGDTTHLFALTDDDVKEMSAGEITKADTVSGDRLDPVENGLFDVGKTGGHGGNRWSHIRLAEAMPNPVMEEPIRRILGLTQKQFEGVISGEHEIQGETGPRALSNALKKVNVDRSLEESEQRIREGSVATRDAAVKVKGYLQTMKKMDKTPADLMMSRVPVLPPNFRPVTAFNNMQMVADPNFLYLDLLNANDDLKSLKKELGDSETGDERLNVYNAFKAISGLGDPVAAKTQEKRVRGLLKHVFGSSPKLGMFQRRVLGASVDTVGRGVITPNPSLNMDQVGLPESKAWTIYRPFVTRQLIRRGMSAVAAAQHIANQSNVARKALVEEMGTRPVVISRAPVLHRYGIMSAWPILTKGSTLQIPPIITPGFNADFDGDAMNYHVPVSDEAVQDAVGRMMPSKNLRSTSDFDVHYTPAQEFLHGLHLASTSRKKGRAKVFRSKADAVAAYLRGEISVDDPVSIAKT